MTIEDLRCGACGGQLQATTRVYWTLHNGDWVIEDFSDEELTLYCENDCGENDAAALGLTEEQFDTAYRALSEMAFAVGQNVVDDTLHHAILAGRVKPPT